MELLAEPLRVRLTICATVHEGLRTFLVMLDSLRSNVEEMHSWGGSMALPVVLILLQPLPCNTFTT